MTRIVRLVIADDHPMYREGLEAALVAIPQLDVVGSACDGQELVELVDALMPDVVLTDLSMPKVDGAAAIRRILATHPEVIIIVLTMHEDDEAVFKALRAGARGYLLKDADRDHIVQAVLAAASGDSVYGSAIGQRIVNFFTNTNVAYTAQAFPGLTARERDVLELVAVGLGNHEIARRLVLSEKTIRNNLASVMTKLEVHDRAAVVAKARDAGIGYH
ncbi:MAG: response regulator transcription factor [Pedococcus sp.]